MKKQLSKLEKIRIKAEATAYGVAPSEIKIIGDLVLVNRIDPHILELMPNSLPSIRHAIHIPNGMKLCCRSQALLTADDKLMLIMSVQSHVNGLKQGEISDIEFAKLQTTLQIGMEALSRATPKMDNQTYCAKRYNEAYKAAMSLLNDISARRERIGVYKASGDNLRCIEVLIRLLIEAIEFITVGEWYSAVSYWVEELTKLSVQEALSKLKQAA